MYLVFVIGEEEQITAMLHMEVLVGREIGLRRGTRVMDLGV